MNRKLEMKVLQGQMDSQGLLTIRFEAAFHFLAVTINDNGVGRQAARALARHKQGTDLTPHEQLAKERIALLNEGKSEKITLHTTDLKNADHSAAGTRVIIQFPTSIVED